MITIHLSTEAKARHIHIATADVDGQTYSASHKTKSPIPVLARTLADAGVDGSTLVTIQRDGKPILRKPVALSCWTLIDVVDEDGRGLRTVKFRPFDAALGSAGLKAAA
ncbi:hypothetical protein AB9F35_11205 [Rhizobium leguminosarum]|uniref:hypothetical protein n=1 Tax=Rhizobium leguminosarum TaxID=384 RepID=UPI003F9CBE4D